ncbi:uncharacterized protein [Diadema setosum]|uniref:uncharacterized protein isoform X2 n=1 Tax=Diadema setosum TaxID=31175 RepID=UPI003B3ADA2D
MQQWLYIFATSGLPPARIFPVSTLSNSMASGGPNVSVDSISQEPITEVTNTILEGITALLTAESQPICTATSSKVASQPWHVFITSDLRIHLACKLVQAVFPSPNQGALLLLDRRMTILLNVASQMENDIFEQASSREEYYHLLGEKIYKIQMVLKEERQRHLVENQASTFPAGTPSNTTASSAPNASIDSIGQGPETEEINGIPEELTALLTAENLPNYTALPSTAASQPWHANISLEHRTHLVHELVQAIFPSPEEGALLDRRMTSLVNVARLMEKDIFVQASSKEEYYHLMAEKVYKITTKLEEK